MSELIDAVLQRHSLFESEDDFLHEDEDFSLFRSFRTVEAVVLEEIGNRRPAVVLASRRRQLTRDELGRLDESGKPACFASQEQWDAWRHAARRSKVSEVSGYCTDCTVEFQAEMVRAGRCRWPSTRFAHGNGVRVILIPAKRAIGSATNGRASGEMQA